MDCMVEAVREALLVARSCRRLCVVDDFAWARLAVEGESKHGGGLLSQRNWANSRSLGRRWTNGRAVSRYESRVCGGFGSFRKGMPLRVAFDGAVADGRESACELVVRRIGGRHDSGATKIDRRAEREAGLARGFGRDRGGFKGALEPGVLDRMGGGEIDFAWRSVARHSSFAGESRQVQVCFYYLETATLWPLLSVMAVEAIVLVWLRRKAHTVIEAVDCNAEGLLLFSEILERLEREPLASPRLREFAAELKGEDEPASRAIRKFARIVYWIDASDGVLAKMAELPFLYSVQVGMAAEAWRRRWGVKLRRWAELTGEMEALLSLATYSYEHPADPFPEFVGAEEGLGFFDGEALGHPLIAAEKCVRNSVRLDAQTRVLLVSGSNMSGKSTLLRVVGINTVLAMAGAPIRGKRLQLTPLKIGTRIRSTDSLQEGRSSFYTEILHIRKVFETANGAVPMVFLFDELLEGTNSKDRRIGAEGLIQGLLKRRAIGIVTTHDLALTEIAAAVGNVMRNMHLEDQVVDGKMRFDYKLREGVVEKSNALELMRLIGLET